jgi:hypothetical protein
MKEVFVKQLRIIKIILILLLIKTSTETLIICAADYL